MGEKKYRNPIRKPLTQTLLKVQFKDTKFKKINLILHFSIYDCQADFKIEITF